MMDRHTCVLALSNFITTLLLFIASGVDVQSDRSLDFVFSSHYNMIFKAVYDLVTSLHQTPFALFHTIIFLDRFFSNIEFVDLTNEDPKGAEGLILLLRVLFIIALETTGGSIDEPVQDRMTLTEKMNLVGFKKFAEYSEIKQNITNSAVSPYTGTTQLSHEEWTEFHTDLSTLSDLPIPLPIPQSNCDDQDMALVVGMFLHHARMTSPDGDIPLYQLSLLPNLPLPPLRCSSPLSPLGYDLNLSDLVSFSPSYKAPVFPVDLNPDDFELRPLPGNFLSQRADSEWDPSVDPIVEAPKIKRRYVAPGSPESTCSLPEPVLHLFQPQPKRGIEIDLIELEAMAAEGNELVQVEVESKERDDGFWRSWLDRCLDIVDKIVSD
ncbi:hypothetical protein BDZ89DRAFT_1123995 [Hymenopellis radicata]|nr:hypothetical protein BDZ89DRAFT_1123995 [Hymenopellis radicata]